MNPLASTKCAGRLLVAFAAISSILFAAGCGGSSTTVVPPPGGSFSNSSLNGTYVISISGTDANVSQNTSSFLRLWGPLRRTAAATSRGARLTSTTPILAGCLRAGLEYEHIQHRQGWPGHGLAEDCGRDVWP